MLDLGKSECVNSLKDFMNVFSCKIDPNTMDCEEYCCSGHEVINDDA